MNLVTRDKIDAFQWLASGIRYLHMLALVLSKKFTMVQVQSYLGLGHIICTVLYNYFVIIYNM